MGPVVTDGSTVTVMLSSPYAGITRSGSYGRRPRAVLSAHWACAPASVFSCLARSPARDVTLPPENAVCGPRREGPFRHRGSRGATGWEDVNVRQPTPKSAATAATADYLNVGSFRFWFVDERWEWS